MIKNSFFIIAMLLMVGFANAQKAAVAILQRSLSNLQSLQSIEYREHFVYANPFSKGDTSIGNKSISIVFSANGLINSMNETTVLENGQGKYADIYKGDTLFSVDYLDSTYTYCKPQRGGVSGGLTSLTDLIKRGLREPFIIVQKKDTVIDNALSFSFLIKTYDKMEVGNHNYTFNYLVIDKKTLMPVYTREKSEGTMEKEGHIIGRVSMFSENNFRAYRVNQKISGKVYTFEKAFFELKNETMLADGSLAPDLNMRDLNNRTVPVTDFKNRLVLLEFGAVDCPANSLANPMLNSLNKKYASKQFAVACIYTSESANQLKMYAEVNNIKFPMYLGDRKLKRAFNTIAVPNFYLIDKNGTIIKAYNGFSDELEAELTKIINSRI